MDNSPKRRGAKRLSKQERMARERQLMAASPEPAPAAGDPVSDASGAERPTAMASKPGGTQKAGLTAQEQSVLDRLLSPGGAERPARGSVLTSRVQKERERGSQREAFRVVQTVIQRWRHGLLAARVAAWRSGLAGHKAAAAQSQAVADALSQAAHTQNKELKRLQGLLADASGEEAVKLAEQLKTAEAKAEATQHKVNELSDQNEQLTERLRSRNQELADTQMLMMAHRGKAAETVAAGARESAMRGRMQQLLQELSESQGRAIELESRAEGRELAGLRSVGRTLRQFSRGAVSGLVCSWRAAAQAEAASELKSALERSRAQAEALEVRSDEYIVGKYKEERELKLRVEQLSAQLKEARAVSDLAGDSEQSQRRVRELLAELAESQQRAERGAGELAALTREMRSLQCSHALGDVGRVMLEVSRGEQARETGQVRGAVRSWRAAAQAEAASELKSALERSRAQAEALEVQADEYIVGKYKEERELKVRVEQLSDLLSAARREAADLAEQNAALTRTLSVREGELIAKEAEMVEKVKQVQVKLGRAEQECRRLQRLDGSGPERSPKSGQRPITGKTAVAALKARMMSGGVPESDQEIASRLENEALKLEVTRVRHWWQEAERRNSDISEQLEQARQELADARVEATTKAAAIALEHANSSLEESLRADTAEQAELVRLRARMQSLLTELSESQERAIELEEELDRVQAQAELDVGDVEVAMDEARVLQQQNSELAQRLNEAEEQLAQSQQAADRQSALEVKDLQATESGTVARPRLSEADEQLLEELSTSHERVLGLESRANRCVLAALRCLGWILRGRSKGTIRGCVERWRAACRWAVMSASTRSLRTLFCWMLSLSARADVGRRLRAWLACAREAGRSTGRKAKRAHKTVLCIISVWERVALSQHGVERCVDTWRAAMLERRAFELKRVAAQTSVICRLLCNLRFARSQACRCIATWRSSIHRATSKARAMVHFRRLGASVQHSAARRCVWTWAERRASKVGQVARAAHWLKRLIHAQDLHLVWCVSSWRVAKRESTCAQHTQAAEAAGQEVKRKLCTLLEQTQNELEQVRRERDRAEEAFETERGSLTRKLEVAQTELERAKRESAQANEAAQRKLGEKTGLEQQNVLLKEQCRDARDEIEGLQQSQLASLRLKHKLKAQLVQDQEELERLRSAASTEASALRREVKTLKEQMLYVSCEHRKLEKESQAAVSRAWANMKQANAELALQLHDAKSEMFTVVEAMAVLRSECDELTEEMKEAQSELMKKRQGEAELAAANEQLAMQLKQAQEVAEQATLRIAQAKRAEDEANVLGSLLGEPPKELFEGPSERLRRLMLRR